MHGRCKPLGNCVHFAETQAIRLSSVHVGRNKKNSWNLFFPSFYQIIELIFPVLIRLSVLMGHYCCLLSINYKHVEEIYINRILQFSEHCAHIKSRNILKYIQIILCNLFTRKGYLYTLLFNNTRLSAPFGRQSLNHTSSCFKAQ